jgi:hypothetical protein
MTKYVSNSTSPLLVSIGGTLVTPADDVKSAGFTGTKDVTETTGSGDPAKTYLGTIRDAQFSLEGFATTSASASGSASAYWLSYAAFNSGSPSTVIIYGSGSVSGGPRETASVVFNKFDVGPHTYNEAAPLSVGGQVTGGVVVDLVP